MERYFSWWDDDDLRLLLPSSLFSPGSLIPGAVLVYFSLLILFIREEEEWSRTRIKTGDNNKEWRREEEREWKVLPNHCSINDHDHHCILSVLSSFFPSLSCLPFDVCQSYETRIGRGIYVYLVCNNNKCFLKQRKGNKEKVIVQLHDKSIILNLYSLRHQHRWENDSRKRKESEKWQ